jgi:hypothetical protein
MIKYSLICDYDHNFDGWFSSSEVYEEQSIVGVVQCPVCGSTNVTKALMMPGVPAKQNKHIDQPQQVLSGPKEGQAAQMVAMMRELRKQVRENAEYVGPRFAEEARVVHDEEFGQRSIYGEASADEVRQLNEDGIDTYPLPMLPEEQN